MLMQSTENSFNSSNVFLKCLRKYENIIQENETVGEI